jgi:hypothetical protein
MAVRGRRAGSSGLQHSGRVREFGNKSVKGGATHCDLDMLCLWQSPQIRGKTDEELARFFRDVQEEDRRRAERAKTLLGQRLSHGGRR